MPSADDLITLPLQWRPRPPSPASAGTLYQFVREYLVRNGGHAGRKDLRSAMDADPALADRLAQSQGFGRLLVNMRHSGWITVKGDEVVATAKTLRKTLPVQQAGSEAD